MGYFQITFKLSLDMSIHGNKISYSLLLISTTTFQDSVDNQNTSQLKIIARIVSDNFQTLFRLPLDMSTPSLPGREKPDFISYFHLPGMFWWYSGCPMGFLIPPLLNLKFLVQSDLEGFKLNGSNNSQATSSNNMS